MNMLFRFLLLAAVSVPAAFLVACGPEAPKDETVNRGIMKFQTDPEGARITIQGKEIGVTPRTTNPVLSAMYIVKFEKEGFVPVWKAVTVLPGKETFVEQRLRPITSAAMITSSPPGAKVIHNEKDSGITPCVLTGLSLGHQSVRLVLPGRVSKELTWEVTNDRPFAGHVVLESDVGTLVIDSTPGEATLTIDGNPKGMTPFRESMEQGEHNIRIEKKGYKPYTTVAFVNRDKQTSVSASLILQPIPLVISSVPAGASVTVNGKFYGLTPYTFQAPVPGKYTVIVAKDKFTSATRQITLEPGNDYNIDIKMSSEMGTLCFVTMPANVSVSVDGRVMGKTVPDDMVPNISKVFTVNDLSEGKHTLEIFHKRGIPRSRSYSFKIRKQETTNLKKTIKLWVPNVEMELKNGMRRTGRILDLKSDPIAFEPNEGVKIEYPKSEIKNIILIKDED